MAATEIDIDATEIDIDATKIDIDATEIDIDATKIDIDGLVSSMKKDMESKDSFMSRNCCIFKTPTILCMHNKNAYVPKAFSIGPFHHNNKEFADTQKIKEKYLLGLISSKKVHLDGAEMCAAPPSQQVGSTADMCAAPPSQQVGSTADIGDNSSISSPENMFLKKLIEVVDGKQKEARECYSTPIHLPRAEFVKMLVIDGCFIIELFCKEKSRKENSRKQNSRKPKEDNQVPREANQVQRLIRCLKRLIGYSRDPIQLPEETELVPGKDVEDNDPIFSVSCMHEFLYHDLILLENQVPWMVLQLLYNVAKGSNEDASHNEKALIQLATGYFEKTFPSIKPPLPRNIKNIKHIPDLIIKWMVSSIGKFKIGEEGWRHIGCFQKRSQRKRSSREEGSKQMPSATSLVEAGIKFRRRLESKSILDITFEDGVLEIPPLLIQETTETVFRNLISFEQCYPNCEARFSSYAVLIDNLINTAKDVDILCENKIFDNWLNPQDAVPFFNKLYHNTFGNTYYYGSLSREVNKYCQRRWPRWRAALVRNYLHTPWAIFSAMAAIILLILSLLQTVYTMEK